MEQVKTTNIVSTPNITGNIGSCTTNEVKQITNSGFFTDKGYTIATNSCTGEVQRLDYYSIGGGITTLFFLGIIIIGYIFGRIS